MIVNQIHHHVFNEMPIRMLAFDSNGTQLRLVERSEIAEQIKFRLSEEDWQGLDESESFDLVNKLGRYAILSHTWFRGKPGDVVYGDWKVRDLNSKGNSKIVKFCEVAARNHGVVYGWMDTICIDKSSSTELDESIRSMYRWYRQSHLCITYLADTDDIPDMHSDAWFTRGWTLQELLAPQNMIFYSKNWTFLAQNNMEMTKKWHTFRAFSESVYSQISQATTIEKDEMLMCFSDPALLPISRVLQLATRRSVTRQEDRIYSLMGLLGISISVAYGEGLPTAFKRLFREIMLARAVFLDLFNHSDQNHLIPSSITQYTERTSVFDRTFFYTSTDLDNHSPIEPTSMTQLGVHAAVFLVPLFRETIPGVPISSNTAYHHAINITWFDDSDKYHVLLRNDASAMFIANFQAKSTPLSAISDAIFCGILNFWRSESAYHIPDHWLYVVFKFSTDLASKTIPDINARDLVQISGPRVQSWPRDHTFGPGYNRLWEQDLRKMGMQVAQLYLA
ncbi:hypothetical protein HYPSUDRAFT_723309 [Hypholoma sublateritium FD-334 SS-4]|uniref:Heterokaryon incompatibility domain-containing protein n=1 Tax=Hypholoma sublateritium (strain FD-334 SS-4) TaxID=945553 RepID=A0A0D2PNM4_HYPSF|nr:hypothetical protein HYPSUDRAFT_723309 [Hypholoma sublateritium FD-334 SS-4]